MFCGIWMQGRMRILIGFSPVHECHGNPYCRLHNQSVDVHAMADESKCGGECDDVAPRAELKAWTISAKWNYSGPGE